MGGLLSVLYTCGLRDALTLPNLPIKCSFETQPVFGPALLSQPVWLFGASLRGPDLRWEVMQEKWLWVGQEGALMGRLVGSQEGVGSWQETMRAVTLESFLDLAYFPLGISTSTKLYSSWARVPGWGGAHLCQAGTRQWPLGLSKSSLKNTNADLFPLR